MRVGPVGITTRCASWNQHVTGDIWLADQHPICFEWKCLHGAENLSFVCFSRLSQALGSDWSHVLLVRRLKSRREWLVSSSCMTGPLCGDQLITPETTIGLLIWVVMLCPFPASSQGWPCHPAVTIRYCEQGEWVLVGCLVWLVGCLVDSHASRSGGYHNKMRQLESTCDRRASYFCLFYPSFTIFTRLA